MMVGRVERVKCMCVCVWVGEGAGVLGEGLSHPPLLTLFCLCFLQI